MVKKRSIKDKAKPKGSTKGKDITVPALLATTGVTTGTSIGCGIALGFALKENKKLKEQIKNMITPANAPASVLKLLNVTPPLTDDVKTLQRLYKEEQSARADLLKEKSALLKENEKLKNNFNECEKLRKEAVAYIQSTQNTR